jgi:hypothetical protein
MADGYLESRYAEYEKKKAEWLKKQKHQTKSSSYGRSNSKNPS